MSRPIWKGTISFGLVNIPVTLYSAEQRSDLHFHLLDSRDHARIRYERVNEITGKETPWNKIVKAYEFEKGNYIIVDEKELEKTAAENFQTVEIQDFVEQKSIEPIYFDKPYYLLPSKQGEKGYILLRKTLEQTHKVGIVKVVIRTRQHIAALLPYKNVLLLNILRFAKEIRKQEEFEISDENAKRQAISHKEIHMAERLVESMTTKWEPQKYHDENRELLAKLINEKIKRNKGVTSPATPEIEHKAKITSGAKVIDFMELLKKSIKEKERKPKRRAPLGSASKPQAKSSAKTSKKTTSTARSSITKTQPKTSPKRKKIK
jgi:DNA end-binding protein Ku